jgi:hypothetical protein
MHDCPEEASCTATDNHVYRPSNQMVEQEEEKCECYRLALVSECPLSTDGSQGDYRMDTADCKRQPVRGVEVKPHAFWRV